MIAMLAFAAVCSAASPAAADCRVSAYTIPWQGQGWLQARAITQVRNEDGSIGSPCTTGYRSRVEVWIWNLGSPRFCTLGTYDSGRNACVYEIGGDAAAEESKGRYGLWTAQANHWLIDTYTGAWSWVNNSTAPIDGGTQHDPEEEPPPNTPIVIPTRSAQTFKLTDVAGGVLFDLDADGNPEQTAWTAPGSGLAFLALDRNGNGLIDSGAELFGGRTHPKAHNGFDALRYALLDAGGTLDSAIRAGDPLYAKLLLWEDVNHNGYSEPGELRPARELLTAIGLGYGSHDRRDGHGNRFRFEGWAEVRTAPGQSRAVTAQDQEARKRLIYDVVFVK